MRRCCTGFYRLLSLCLLHRPLGQDLFLPKTASSRAIGEVALSGLGPNVGASGRPDSQVFTISPDSDPNLCLDIADGHGSNRLQIWQCNGHENQLFFFDQGSYKIRSAGNGGKCVDAGQGMTAGTIMFMWDCNNDPQQYFGYDPTAKTIFLSNSMSAQGNESQLQSPRATMCMDLAGMKKDLGTAVQVWGCNGKWNQQFNLQVGITIRPLADSNFCLDLEGGKTDKGTNVQLWKCNGLYNQKWLFDNWSIRPATDNTKCLDAGSLQAGNNFVIWDCNGQNQQNFGYQQSDRTIYLARSAKSSQLQVQVERPMASLCLDIAGGKMEEGPNLDTWNCNSCWNQQWQVIGPYSTFSAMSKVTYEQPPATDTFVATSNASKNFLAHHSEPSLQAEGGCPPRPSPSPTPAPGPSPTPYVLSHCSGNDQHNWAYFKTQQDLNADPWGAYIHMVYGEVPSTGYPICIYNFFLLYKPLLTQANVQMPAVDNDCPTADGTYFSKMSGFPATDWGWIRNSNLAAPSTFQVPAQKWVEIMHTAFAMDGSATWFYYAPGSGVFMWMGNTKAYNDHPEGVKDLTNEACKDPAGQIGNNECQDNFEDMYKAAKNAKLDSIQFVKHADMQCSLTDGKKMGNYAIEIVDLGGSGKYACSQPQSGNTRFRAGWEAKSICNCDNTKKAINCQGFAMSR